MSRAGARLVAGSRFVLRTPLLPIDAMFELGRDPSGGRAWLLAALERPEGHEAIAIVLRQMRNGRFDRSRPVRPYLMRIATNLALRRARLSIAPLVLPKVGMR